jgi:hypothetical protein
MAQKEPDAGGSTLRMQICGRAGVKSFKNIYYITGDIKKTVLSK